MTRIFESNRLHFPPWAADFTAFWGLILYVAQSLRYAYTTVVSLDEGAYLLKGYLFAKGIYQPFQPYGVWTNKAPLAFLIPGYIQLWFGPGLRSGRYFAVLLGLLTLVGTWVAARRLAGRWLSAGAVWVLVLSPVTVKLFSVAISQGLVACMLAWTLAFSLGGKRSIWQLIASSIFAGLMILTRQNMVLVWPLLVLYIFWQHGRKAGVWSLVAGLGVILIGHMIYWPNILQMWVPWVPSSAVLTLLRLDQYKPLVGGTSFWPPDMTLDSRLLSVFQGFRVHFVALVGSLAALLLWSRSSKWKGGTAVRAGRFLALLFFGLLAMHMWAAIGKDYCVYCFTPYVAFFNVAGILLVVVSIQSWRRHPHALIQLLILIVILTLFMGIGLSMFEDVGDWLVNLSVPRMASGHLLAGSTTLWELLGNKFHLDYGISRKIVPGVVGALSGIVFLVIIYFVQRLRAIHENISFGALSLMVFLASGFVFSPVLAGSLKAVDCDKNIIAAHEDVGQYLQRIILPGSTIYWNGGPSMAPVLYLPDVRIYPPQINDGFAYRFGGDSDMLLKYGLYNNELKRQWRMEANYIVIEEDRYTRGWKSFLSPDRFAEFQRAPQALSCSNGSRLRVFQRLP